MRKSFNIIVSGKVQGVWFRRATLEKALEFKLTGWVRNIADGSVEIHVEGEERDILLLVDWCRSGPDLARVSQVITSEIVVEEYKEFVIC